VSSESSSVMWAGALDAVSRVEQQEILMLPPTWLTCLEVGQHADPAAVLAEASGRTVEMFMPEVVADGDEFILSTPPAYAALMAAR
jgi:enhancing lycopene biosynthesis protein 2